MANQQTVGAGANYDWQVAGLNSSFFDLHMTARTGAGVTVVDAVITSNGTSANTCTIAGEIMPSS